MRLRVLGSLEEGVDDRHWSGLVGIADAEVNEVLPFGNSFRLRAGDLAEQIWRYEIESLGSWDHLTSFHNFLNDTGQPHGDRAVCHQQISPGRYDLVAHTWN